METQALTFARAGAMPAPTWNFLKMNDTDFEVPAGLKIDPRVSEDVPWLARGAADEFENALDDAQRAWEADHPEPTAEELAELEAYRAAEADATYGGTAQSGYQAGADAMEEARSLSVAFEHGVGEEVAAYLRYAAGKVLVVKANAGETVDAHISVAGDPGSMSVAAIDVVADADSTVNLTLAVDGIGAEDGNFENKGVTGTTLRVFADEGSRVSVARVQTLDSGYVDVDDMGVFAGADCRVDVSQTVLGASQTFTGFAADLRGDGACLEIDTHYLGHGDQSHDFNYIVRHHGRKTECDLVANGVLAGKSKKTLRGTIDLIKGAKGAQGSEKESVLLVDEGVVNKTVPVILCNEDDVAGNHGATIGHIREEQLFYLASRGLSQEEAERMFVGAALEQAAIDARDDASRAGVLRLGEQLSAGFAGLFEEEADSADTMTADGSR